MSQFERSEQLWGADSTHILSRKKVALFGVGGVGGYVAEMLARGGVGEIMLVDCDTVSLTNLNRQIIALHSTLGEKKTEVMRRRILDIHPQARVRTADLFVTEENAGDFPFADYDYVVDAIDAVSGKVAIVTRCVQAGIPVISAMGAGNKRDPSRLKIVDLSKTSVCPLARVMRYELKKRGITKGVPVAFSDEIPQRPQSESGETKSTGRVPASLPYLPSAMGILIGARVLEDLLRESPSEN